MTSNNIFANDTNESSKYLNVCSPITTLEEAWNYLENPPEWINGVIELLPRSSTVIKNTELDCHAESDNFRPTVRLHHSCVPRTLVCHDMKGGYLEDRLVGPVYKGNGYAFYRWAQIDTFVYFSHYFITIPPLNWINVAHRNGVKILGTLITEWGPGKLMCDEFLKTLESTQRFASILADICVMFKIDGWLLNIENPISNVSRLVQFIEYLTRLVHIRRPGSLIIWYDSVTKDGKLEWQNELNDLNRCYFDVCDGIYLNYTWKETNLQKTVQAAKYRNLDVYVGVDVFGRNSYAGGEFNTYLAVEKIREYNFSMAVFGQGWTHETLKKEPEETFMERFMDRDNAFWRSLWPFLYTHLPILQFHTTFYCGSDTEFYKLNNQELQLTHFLHGINKRDEDTFVRTLIDRCNCLQMYFDGKNQSCVISKSHLDPKKSYIHHLFSSDIKITNNIILYTYTKAFKGNPDDLSLVLLVQNAEGTYKQIICYSEDKNNLLDNATVTEVNASRDEAIVKSITSMYNYPPEWKLRCFVINSYNSKILEIGAKIDKGQMVCLCGIGITNVPETD